MKNHNQMKGGRSLNIFEILTLIFIVLKLSGIIKWSWIWVLSPMWIVITACLIAYIYMIHEDKKLKKQFKKDYMNLKKEIEV